MNNYRNFVQTNKLKLLNNLKNADAIKLKEWIIEQIRDNVKEKDIRAGQDNGYTDNKHHKNPVEDFCITIPKNSYFMFHNFKD
jgi:hypothetical protein